MAKKNDKDQQDYESWKARYKLNSSKDVRGQFEALKEVRDKYADAKTSRQNNCYWLTGTGDDKNSKGAGGDWITWWDKQEKAWSQWYQPVGNDSFQSNVKSAMTTGRVESVLNKIKRSNYRWDAKPICYEDKGKEKVARKLLDVWFATNADAKSSLSTWFKDALIHGSAILRVRYERKTRKLSFPVTDASEIEKMDDKEKESAKETLGEGKVVYGKPQEKMIVNDVILEPKPIASVYFDPQARSIHGNAYPARYVIERRIVSYDDFKAEFENDDNAINVDKVQPISSYSHDEDYTFFEVPRDVIDQEAVEILEYENVLNDEYIIVANDLVIKRTPLPYNHKELTYHKLDCIEFIHQFYHVGLPDFLMNTQGTSEILTNLLIDYIYRSLNLKYMVDSNVFGEFTESHMREDSQYIPIDTTDGKPLQSKVMQLQHAPIGFDAYKLYDMLERNATLSTQIDPMQMSLAPSNTQATIGVMNKEQMEVLIASLIENFSTRPDGLNSAGRQIWALMQQKYTKKEVKEKVGKDGKTEYEEEWRKIRLDGFKIVKDEKGIQVEEDEENEYNFFEMEDEFINTKQPLEVYIMPDSLQVSSRGLEMQKSREAYAQLMPNAVDPADSQMMMAMKAAGRVPLYDARKLAEYYSDANELPEDLMLEVEQTNSVDIKEAEEQSQRILDGEFIAGVPGRSKGHLQVHAKIISELTVQMDKLNEEIIKNMQGQEVLVDPMTGQPMPPSPEPQSLDRMERLSEALQRLISHFQDDNLPADMFDEAVLGKAQQAIQEANPQPPAPPQGMPMGGMGGMDAGVEPPVGSNAPMPDQMGGEIPMPTDMGNGGGGMAGMV